MVKTPPKSRIKSKSTPISISPKPNQDILDFDNSKPTIKSVSTLVKFLHETQNNLLRENNELKLRLDKLESDNITLQKTNTLQENTIRDLLNETSELKFELNEIRQETLDNQFNINGLPQLSKDESLDVVLKVANELDIHLTPSDVTDVTYFNNKKTNKHDYIFKLKNKELKKEFIQKRKSKLMYVNHNLEIFSVNSNSSTINKNNSRIFINEHLTQFNHQLVNHAKSLKNCGYKYVWYKFGKVFVKKTDVSEVINVRSYQTINNLIQRSESQIEP